MVRRVSLTQFRSQLRQMANKQKQAIGSYNRAVRQVNQNRRQAVAKANQAISRYNQAVRTHNANVRAHRPRRAQAFSRLQGIVRSARYEQFTSSVYNLHSAFVRLEKHYEQPQTPDRESLLDMSEQETANSLEVMNALLSEDGQTEESAGSDSLQTSDLVGVLEELSPDLRDRWTGALVALNPRNPEATRHFCTSARETFVELLALTAPDDKVLEAVPACDKTPEGSPTRRARIRFLLHRQGVREPEAEDFATQNIENIVQLFPILSGGTHGPARRFALPELAAVKRRVEDGIRFLLAIAGGPSIE